MGKAKSHVNKKEAQAVADYATDVAYALSLPRWRILVMTDPCGDDAMATVDTVDGKWTARIWLCEDWMTQPYDTRRETITHEVCHLIHMRLADTVIEDSKPLMRNGDHRDWTRRVRREFELMVDHLAVFLAETHSLERAWDKAHGRTS
ncbi:hypothetical protein [uncultured Nocardioides sp.]|uniref:hypothetical protein n=1 Tax=uncultured Nocardioides sp. TaxID=198441 RepID=UPI002631CB4B|nr:hypothetical protein [uncultured Nocardioides sp.]